MSWITAILQLYSQVADLLGNVIVKRINIRIFDLLARFHYILNLPRNTIFFTLALYRRGVFECTIFMPILACETCASLVLYV